MKCVSPVATFVVIATLTSVFVLADTATRQLERVAMDFVRGNPSSLAKSDVFTFVRIRYDSSGGFGESWYHYDGRDWERWETDYPRAERNLLFRLAELTSLKVDPNPISMRLTDERLFDYPLIFMSDVGWQVLSGKERRHLHHYLDNGGFLWVDDFWGAAEWNNFHRNTSNLAPDWRWREIPNDHAILSNVYPLKECPQVPARIFYAQRRLSYDPPQIHRYPNGGSADLSQVHLMGLFNPQGRLLAVATHNTDIADGWERETESQEFFEKFSIKAYALAINVIVYAERTDDFPGRLASLPTFSSNYGGDG